MDERKIKSKYQPESLHPCLLFLLWNSYDCWIQLLVEHVLDRRLIIGVFLSVSPRIDWGSVVSHPVTCEIGSSPSVTTSQWISSKENGWKDFSRTLLCYKAFINPINTSFKERQLCNSKCYQVFVYAYTCCGCFITAVESRSEIFISNFKRTIYPTGHAVRWRIADAGQRHPPPS